VGHKFKTNLLDFQTVDLIEGFCGIMYPPGSINTVELRKFSAVSKKTFISDDMTISMYLSFNGIQKFATIKKNNYKFHHILKLFQYGLETDALHNRQDHYQSYYIALKHLCCNSTVSIFKKVYNNTLMASNDISLKLRIQDQVKDQYQESTEVNENHKSIVNIGGLAFPFLESVNTFDDFSDDPFMIDQIKKSNIITCTQFQLRHLIKYLPEIQQNFVLVTTNCDYSAPNDIFGGSDLKSTIAVKNAILMNPFLQMWFTNNADEIHPKITPIPLGIDWHTPQIHGCRNDIAFLHELYEDFKTRQFKKIPLLENRKQKIAITFANSLLDNATKIIPMSSSKLRLRESRRFCLQKLQELKVINSEIIPFTKDRIQFWSKLKDYCFVASPHGVGEDCHRTYEALAIGCIVIVQCKRESGMRPLFEEMRDQGIRIMIVESWANVTTELLQSERDYWISMEKSAIAERLLKQVIQNEKKNSDFNDDTNGEEVAEKISEKIFEKIAPRNLTSMESMASVASMQMLETSYWIQKIKSYIQDE
jgi:hypothetical protein